jgi:hypothetical protein
VAPTGSPTDAGSGWAELPASPLSARHSATAIWTGTEAVIVGGTDQAACPPNADCELRIDDWRRDGAAFDPAAGTWRKIPDLPVAPAVASTALADGRAYLLGRSPVDPEPFFLAWDGVADRWDILPPPPEPDSVSALVAAGDRIVAVRGTHENGVTRDAGYDPASRTWTDLPLDPFAPSYDRSMVWTGAELVLLAVPLEGRLPTEPPLYRAAALDPATAAWRPLPDGEVMGWDPTWYWAGGRIVNPTAGSADGGQTNNFGRPYPFGGILTPPAGEWSPLPDPPADHSGYRGLRAAGPDHVVSPEGWILDVPRLTWSVLRRPPDAANGGEAVAWAGDRLIVWGGVRAEGDANVMVNEGAAFRP